ncbi:DUF6714 family protein [Pseudoduganella sp. HUAS MS19]
MQADADLLRQIDAAFGETPRPEHFTDYTLGEECAEQDQLLRQRDRSTLAIEDVGNICWQPISFCSPAGLAYYMPALARLAMAPPTWEYGWYGDTLEIHLSSASNFRAYCTPLQRTAIADLIDHLNSSRAALEERQTEDQTMRETSAFWRHAL